MPTSNEAARSGADLEREAAILAVLLNDSYAILPVMGILPDPDAFSLPAHAAIYGTILGLTSQGTVPNIYTVAAQLAMPIDDLAAISRRFSTKISKEVPYLALDVAKSAKRRRIGQALEEAEALLAMPTDDLDGLAQTVMDMVAGAAEASNETDCSVEAISKAVDDEIAEAQAGHRKGLPTGLTWLDGKTHGLLPGQVWWIGAPYKMRKTSLLRNIILSALDSRASVSWVALEGHKNDAYAGLWAMLATRLLLERNAPMGDLILSDDYLLYPVDGQTRSRYQVQALADAKRILDGYNLRIYGSVDGCLSVENILMKGKRDRFIKGMDLIAVDYLQKLGQGKLFERVEHATHLLQNAIGSQAIAGIILSQFNEAAVQAIDEESYSPGSKGGGDPAASADNYIVTRYNGKVDPKKLTVELKLARHAQVGQQDYEINPSSGLIINPTRV